MTVQGRPLAGLTDDELTRFRRRHLGFVFQQFHLLPYLTAAQNVELPLRLAGRRTDRRLVAEALAGVGLAERGHALPAELSGGQQQRVAVARALVTRPAVLFADEPTGALDSTAARGVMDLLRAAADEHGQTIVLVTHDPAIAAAMVVTEKAVGKHITNIFGKLGLPVHADDNRRVLAVLQWLQDRGWARVTAPCRGSGCAR